MFDCVSGGGFGVRDKAGVVRHVFYSFFGKRMIRGEQKISLFCRA